MLAYGSQPSNQPLKYKFQSLLKHAIYLLKKVDVDDMFNADLVFSIYRYKCYLKYNVRVLYLVY